MAQPSMSVRIAANIAELRRNLAEGRNQIETTIQSGGTSVPAAVYNALVAAVTNLRATPAANYTGAQ